MEANSIAGASLSQLHQALGTVKIQLEQETKVTHATVMLNDHARTHAPNPLVGNTLDVKV